VDHRADGLDEMRTPWAAAWAAWFCRPRLEKAERTGRGGVTLGREEAVGNWGWATPALGKNWTKMSRGR